jgi:hypothetical protein
VNSTDPISVILLKWWFTGTEEFSSRLENYFSKQINTHGINVIRQA